MVFAVAQPMGKKQEKAALSTPPVNIPDFGGNNGKSLTFQGGLGTIEYVERSGFD